MHTPVDTCRFTLVGCCTSQVEEMVNQDVRKKLRLQTIQVKVVELKIPCLVLVSHKHFAGITHLLPLTDLPSGMVV